MTKMVECPNCHGRGQIGYCVKGKDGNACFDFECEFCRGRGVVSKRRADKYERDTQTERKGTTEEVETIFEGAE